MVGKLEKQLGEKALYNKYDEKTGRFNEVNWSDHTDEMYNVSVAGYNIKLIGEFIIKNKCVATKSSQVLKGADCYYGFSHRAVKDFKIGDMLFDEDWRINSGHPDYETYVEAWKKNTDADIEDFIPFNRRGSVKIENEKQCYQAALNFAAYVS